MSNKPKISKRAERMWTRLTEWYGARFAEQYGITPPPDWCAVIDEATDSVIERVLSEIRVKHPAHPPTFPEFEALFAQFSPKKGVDVPSTQAQLDDFVMRVKKPPFAQCRGWTYTYETTPAGQRVISGVVIPTVGELRGFRVTVEEMLSHVP